MKKIGRINIIEENSCALGCSCGWNITIGGEDQEDIEMLKQLLKIIFPKT